MRCPYCSTDDDRVIDSRPAGDGAIIRRRRECNACFQRFTTYERIEEAPLKVLKKDGRRVDFNREKIRQGVKKACEKRPVSIDQIDAMVTAIEKEIHENYDDEVPALQVGEIVMEHLKRVDHVAYVRFASVYREFKDIEDFKRTLENLENIKTEIARAQEEISGGSAAPLATSDAKTRAAKASAGVPVDAPVDAPLDVLVDVRAEDADADAREPAAAATRTDVDTTPSPDEVEAPERPARGRRAKKRPSSRTMFPS